MRRLLRVAVALALVVIAVASCSGGNAFPTGKWTPTTDANQDWVMAYGSDGKWSLTAAGSATTSGTYSTDGNTLEFLTDTLCMELGAEQGTYTWELENDQLTFKKQTDECAARSGLMTDQAWKPVK